MKDNNSTMESRHTFFRIQKSRGFLYAHDNQLYKQVKRKGNVLYLKCCVEVCDGSAKLEHDIFSTGVSRLCTDYMWGRFSLLYCHKVVKTWNNSKLEYS